MHVRTLRKTSYDENWNVPEQSESEEQPSGVEDKLDRISKLLEQEIQARQTDQKQQREELSSIGQKIDMIVCALGLFTIQRQEETENENSKIAEMFNQIVT